MLLKYSFFPAFCLCFTAFSTAEKGGEQSPAVVILRPYTRRPDKILTRRIDAATQASDQKLIKDLFNDQYDPQIRPVNFGGIAGPVIVSVNMYVRSITKVENHEFELQLTFRQQWKDERLNFTIADPQRYLSLKSAQDKIWTPDLFFSNDKESNYHNMMDRNEYVRIWPDGEVLYSTRITLKLSCPMMYRNFPMDRQRCSIRMASYGYTTEDIIFKWKKADPVQVTSDLFLTVFSLEQFTTDYCDAITNTGTYSCLRVDLQFKREFSPYLTQIYIPCAALVIVSYLSFWIHVTKAITARAILLILTFLMLYGHTIFINQTVPQVSYTKAVDWWTGACLLFVFVALLEFIIVQYIASKENSINSDVVSHSGTTEGILLDNDVKLINNALQTNLKCMVQKIKRGSSLSETVDWIFRISFPIVFIIFVLYYANAYYDKGVE